MITAHDLHKYYEYKDGKLFWKVKRSNRVKAGSEVGCLQHRDGYIVTKINGKRCGVHRIIFALFHGYFADYVDHINGNTSDNRIENLRSASCIENQYNAKIRKDNTSGVKNVTWHNKKEKWQVRITVNKVRKNIGTFKTIEEAKKAAIEARIKLHKEFANHG